MTGLFRDTIQALRFYSRLPIPALPGESQPHAAPDFGRIARAVPLAGAVIGAVGAAVVLAGTAAGLGGLLVALLALTALVLVTGAFHEDGLADSADGIGGGRTREHKLDIMKDSRIGTYGGAALVLSLLLRTAALAALIERGALEAALALVAAAVLSRTAALWIAFRLPPARAEGAAFAAGRPGAAMLGQAFALALLLAAVLLVPESGGMAVLGAVAAAAAATAIMSRIAMRTLGGQTGDVAGATQQVAEIAILVALAMVAPSGPRI